MEETLRVLNALAEDGVLARYAIGGAMAALFYTEPLLTYDLDVFTVLPTTQSGLITLQPIYDELARRGYEADGDTIVIENVPVQFLLAYNPLLEEALEQADDLVYGETATKVLKPEHLMAIMLQTGRDKDKQRFELFRRTVPIDSTLMEDLVTRFELAPKWTEWTK